MLVLPASAAATTIDQDGLSRLSRRPRRCCVSWSFVLLLIVYIWRDLEWWPHTEAKLYDVPSRTYTEVGNSTIPSGILYTRLPKTGSSTVKKYFEQRSRIDDFSHLARDVCHHCTGSISAAINALSELMRREFETGRRFILSSHCYWLPSTQLPPHTHLIATVRHPVLRKKSSYQYFWPRLRIGNFSSCLCQNETSFNDCVLNSTPECDEKILGLDYTYLQYFCGYAEICSQRPDSIEAFQRALRNLETYFMIGLTEDLSGFVRELARSFPFLGYDESLLSARRMQRVSTSENNPGTTSLSANAVKKVLQYNKGSNELLLYREILRSYFLKHDKVQYRNGLARSAPNAGAEVYDALLDLSL